MLWDMLCGLTQIEFVAGLKAENYTRMGIKSQVSVVTIISGATVTHHAKCIVEREVLTPTGPDFQHDSLRLADDFTSQGIFPPPHRAAIGHPRIKRGETGIGDLLRGREMAHLIAHCVAPFVRSLPAVNSDEEFPLKTILHGFCCPNKATFYRNGYFQ